MGWLNSWRSDVNDVMGSWKYNFMSHGRKIAVIGLGYVGLPVAVSFARAGVPVVGFDIDAARVAELREGNDRTREVEVQDLRHPSLVRRAIGMSGPYQVKRWTDGYVDDNVYFNSPCDFIPLEHEPERLHALRELEVILAIGRDDPARADNEALNEILRHQGIRSVLRVWDGSAHDWPWWQTMMRLYVDGAN